MNILILILILIPWVANPEAPARPECRCAPSGRRKYDHITPVLKDLRCLRVAQRIQFKVVITVYKAIHNTASAYLQELIVPYVPSRGLRSQEHNLPCVSFTRSTMAGNSFQHRAPRSRMHCHSICAIFQT